MRIAFVSTILGYPWGGADTLWTHAAEAAAARGDTLLVSVSPATAAHDRIKALVSAGVRLHLRRPPTVPASLGARIARRVKRLLDPADPLISTLAHFRPDLVVFSLGGTYDLTEHPEWVTWLSASGTPFRLVANWQQENPELPPESMAAMRACLEGALDVFFVSTRNLEVTRRHLGAALLNASVIQNPLRWTPADTSPWPAESPWSLAAVARLEAVKGIDLLLDAAAKALPAGDAGWRLQVYGRGPDEADLRSRAETLGLGGNVFIRGYVRDLRAVWAENHLLVSPAREEGVPMTIPEAMLCARPVLATAVGGARDWIEHGTTGFLCPAATVDALAESLGLAWSRRQDWRMMGERAASQAMSRYRPGEQGRLIAPIPSRP